MAAHKPQQASACRFRHPHHLPIMAELDVFHGHSATNNDQCPFRFQRGQKFLNLADTLAFDP